jgi:hypothetical protein
VMRCTCIDNSRSNDCIFRYKSIDVEVESGGVDNKEWGKRERSCEAVTGYQMRMFPLM